MSGKVTVVTVVFNLLKAGRKEAFRRCLESVKQQSYANIEHIIVDGASTDGTLEIIKEYADKGWITYLSEPDRGIYDAMNKGIKLATGDYVIFLNSDDYYHNLEAIAQLVTALEQAQADFTYAIAKIVNKKKKTELMDENIAEFWNQMPFCHQTMLCRRQVLLDQGCFNSEYKLAADYELIIKLILQDYKGIYVPEEIVTFSADGASSVMEEISHKEQGEIFRNMYSSFYTFKDLQEAEALRGIQKVSLNFLQALREFLISKQLRHLNMEKCLQAIQKPLNDTQKHFTFIKLADAINLLTITSYRGTTNVKLFGILTIMGYKSRSKKTRLKLFGIIPIYRTQLMQQDTVKYIKILGLIPLVIRKVKKEV